MVKALVMWLVLLVLFAMHFPEKVGGHLLLLLLILAVGFVAWAKGGQ